MDKEGPDLISEGESILWTMTTQVAYWGTYQIFLFLTGKRLCSPPKRVSFPEIISQNSFSQLRVHFQKANFHF